MGTKNYDNATDLITFSRASGGTYLDSSGILQTAVTDIPRIDYNPDGTVKGLLIEEARTNLLTYSSEFDNVVWQKLVGGTASVPVVTPNHAEAPDGSMTADRLQVALNGGSTANDFSTLLRNVSPTPTGTDTRSVWLKSTDGVSTYDLSLEISLPIPLAVVTGSWQRFDVTLVDGENGSVDLGLRGNQATSDSADILVWGYQLEDGSFPTSYIPTSGSTATRAADIASIPVTDFGYNQDQGTVYVNGTFRDTETIVTIGSTTLAADADGEKDYATTYSSDPSATSIELNGGTYENLQYYPRKLTAAQITELTT